MNDSEASDTVIRRKSPQKMSLITVISRCGLLFAFILELVGMNIGSVAIEIAAAVVIFVLIAIDLVSIVLFHEPKFGDKQTETMISVVFVLLIIAFCLIEFFKPFKYAVNTAIELLIITALIAMRFWERRLYKKQNLKRCTVEVRGRVVGAEQTFDVRLRMGQFAVYEYTYNGVTYQSYSDCFRRGDVPKRGTERNLMINPNCPTDMIEA